MGQSPAAAAPGARSTGPAQVPFLLHVHGSQAVAVRVLAGHRENEVAGGGWRSSPGGEDPTPFGVLTAPFGCISVAVWMSVRFTGPFLPLEGYVRAAFALWASR